MAPSRRAQAPARPARRSTRSASRLRDAASRIALCLAGAAVVAALPSPPAAAAPAPKPAPVAATVRHLQAQADALVERYDAASVALQSAARREVATRAALVTQQRRTALLRQQMSRLAAAAYHGTGPSPMLGLLTSDDPQQFLAQASSLDVIAHGQHAGLVDYQNAQRRLAVLQARAAAEVAHRRATQVELGRRRQQLLASLRAQQALLHRLTAAARARLVATPGVHVSPSSVHASGRAAAAIKFAYAQLGKPYRWGAAGPGAYDCSGLTMAAWRAAGISLPHSAQAQYGAGRHVPIGALRPGDLVFFGSPIHHVGLYIGGGNMIAAPHTGDVVKVQRALRGDLVGAVRPG